MRGPPAAQAGDWRGCGNSNLSGGSLNATEGRKIQAYTKAGRCRESFSQFHPFLLSTKEQQTVPQGTSNPDTGHSRRGERENKKCKSGKDRCENHCNILSWNRKSLSLQLWRYPQIVKHEQAGPSSPTPPVQALLRSRKAAQNCQHCSLWRAGLSHASTPATAAGQSHHQCGTE